MTTFVIKQGDTYPPISASLQDDNGVVDLTGASVTFVMTLKRQDAITFIEEDANIDGAPTSGDVSYDWQEGDTDVPGYYRAEWIVTLEGGEILTFPNGGYASVTILPNIHQPEVS